MKEISFPEFDRHYTNEEAKHFVDRGFIFHKDQGQEFLTLSGKMIGGFNEDPRILWFGGEADKDQLYAEAMSLLKRSNDILDFIILSRDR